MTPRRAARERIRQQGTAGVSLFPFLAVLICTMGALILLLVVIARQARIEAAQSAILQTSEKQDRLETERRLVQERISRLKASREKTQSQLAEARLQLGRIEDDAQNLRDRLASLEAAWAELESLQSDGTRRQQELQAELLRLKTKIAATQQQLAEAQRAAAGRRRSYAVVPYQGPNETHRRPIYLECRADAVVLQPEGIVFTESDFAGPLGPGNPLDVALRATRQHLAGQREIDSETSGEPYPLLLVRPDGIEAYYAARAAMQSWAADFGYELIGQDWKLDFQPPDPRLAELLSQVVDAARARQARLAQAVPRYYGSRQQAKYRAAPYRGGVVHDYGGGSGGSGFPAHPPSAPFGGPFDSQAQGRPGQSSLPEGVLAGRPPREEDGPPGSTGVAPRPGEWTPSQHPPDRDQHSEQPPKAQTQCLAEIRGRDWALPGAADGSIPLTRPIRIDCHPDRLLVVPEEGSARSKEIPLGPRTEDAVDDFVAAVWELIDSWGIAGKGMYWRPVLNVRVAPGGETRYAELKTLLEDSGLNVKTADER